MLLYTCPLKLYSHESQIKLELIVHTMCMCVWACIYVTVRSVTYMKHFLI
jgi:hypothetical protein